jgi:hypothetical protein
MNRLGVLGLALAIAIPAHAQSTAECDRGGTLSPAGIGPVRIGMRVDSLAARCRIIARRFVSEYMRTLYEVRIGADTAFVWEAGGVVDLINVDSPVHRTADSLGVGSSAARLLHLPGITGGAGDGDYVLSTRTGPHCGLSYHLDPTTSDMMSSVKGDAIRMLEMRGGGVVSAISIRGECARREDL